MISLLFSIDFAIPTYSISQDVWYRYKLEGLDHEWIASQRALRELYYTSYHREMHPSCTSFKKKRNMDWQKASSWLSL